MLEIILFAQAPLLVLLGVVAVNQRKVTKAIELLEINTNSIKDALIKSIGEAEFAKGVKQESDRWTKNWTKTDKHE